jgi:hypothetical protein
MPHLIEPAPSARSKCRGCGERIAAGVVRFGETLPNPFAEGETMTHWFHLDCAAFKRPEPLLEALSERSEPVPDRELLEPQARLGVAHRRLVRVDGAERASTGRAQCRSCHEAIPKDAWRIKLVFYENDRFMPAGFVHTRCALGYFETPGSTELLPRLRRFSPGLGEDDLKGLQTEIDAR